MNEKLLSTDDADLHRCLFFCWEHHRPDGRARRAKGGVLTADGADKRRFFLMVKESLLYILRYLNFPLFAFFEDGFRLR